MEHSIFPGEGEKKVEYIELIYDLIFVYMIGRNNSLLHALDNGFIPLATYVTYLLSMLIALQIWYHTTLFINRYGTNGPAEYIGIFINMYLIYYMVGATRADWQDYYFRYNIAWALILINLAVQYWIKLKKRAGAPWEEAHIRYNMRMLLIQAAIILCSVPLYFVFRQPLSLLALVFWIVSAFVTRRANDLVGVDFPHLTERVMLYVVFSFGEMIIGVAGYFEEGFTLSGVYYSLMAFLIAAGLFLSYGFLYEHIIDRNKNTSGTGYMLIHIFLITALNNITVALEFMREPNVSEIPKNIFLVVSFIVFFVFLFLTGLYSYRGSGGCRRLYLLLLPFLIGFAVLMGIFYRYSAVSIAVTVLFLYSVFAMIVWQRRRQIGKGSL